MTLLAAIVGTDVVHIYEIHERLRISFIFFSKYNKNAISQKLKCAEREREKEGRMRGSFSKI
jgi:hypothetical protein